MQTYRVTGQVNAFGQLTATVPSAIGPGEVDLLVFARQSKSPASEAEESEAWLSGVAREWHDDLADPRQDIYALNDGVPTDGTR